MKRLLLVALAILAGATVRAQAPDIYDLYIYTELQEDGSARIYQVWNVNCYEGTEWYYPINNLNGRVVRDLEVLETSPTDTVLFTTESKWNSDRSIGAKAGKCGIAKTDEGVEICWGIGSYGPHTFHVEYWVDGFVMRYNDGSDGFIWQFVNDLWDNPPQRVQLYVVNGTGKGSKWSEDNEDARVWGFGVEGDRASVAFDDDGDVDAQVVDMEREESVILMMQFKEGEYFTPTLQAGKSFEEAKDEAFEGSNYGISWLQRLWWFIEELGWMGLFIVALPFILLWLLLRKLWLKIFGRYDKKIFGDRKVEGWFREAPLGGSLLGTYSLLAKGDKLASPDTSNLIGAYFLRWVMDGSVVAQKDPKKDSRINLAFTKTVEEMNFHDNMEKTVFEAAIEAAGDNRILEKNEFKRWSEKHYNTVSGWDTYAKTLGTAVWRPVSQEECRHAVQFKNFLTDYTLVADREVPEVGLWQDYMVFAQLFGVADKVSKSMEQLFPAEYEEYCQRSNMMDAVSTSVILSSISTSSTSMMSAARAKHHAEMVRSSGGGGSFSRGGGGGFSGGGHGGGTR